MAEAKLNASKTANKVIKFLADDLNSYLANAGMHRADLKSPQLDPTGVSPHGTNSAEKKILKIFDYQNKCLAVGSAINDCTENDNCHNRTILRSIAIFEQTDTRQILFLNYSDRTFYRKKVEALCEFAARIQYWALQFDTKIPELRVYKRERKPKSAV